MKIFLAVSYSAHVDAKGIVLATYRSDLEEVISTFEKDDHQVFCAPREDGWVLNDLSPKEAFKLDTDNIDSCDIFIAFVGTNISAGIQLELGYAFANHKQIALVTKEDEELAYINKGLIENSNVSLITYTAQSNLINKLRELDVMV